MLIYEVSALVRTDLVPEYERYMRDRHIPDVLASGCFLGAAMIKAGENRYRIAYRLADTATLQRYLDKHAPALRADHARRFPSGVELSRETWTVLQDWDVEAAQPPRASD